jgi:hypothetical protein
MQAGPFLFRRMAGFQAGSPRDRFSLWFKDNAKEDAKAYTSVFKGQANGIV